MGRSLQNKIEEKTIDILFELGDELEIEVNKIPEVYYVGKTTSFNNLGLNLDYSDAFYTVKFTNKPLFIPDKKIIFVANFNDQEIAEEVGHFIHYQYLSDSENYADKFGKESISEMLGFFCSKLIDSKRKMGYHDDNFKFDNSFSGILNQIKFIIDEGGFENLVHQQGYLLGERLYNKYITNQISKSQIKKIIKKPLVKKYSGFYEFLHWKYEVLK